MHKKGCVPIENIVKDIQKEERRKRQEEERINYEKEQEQRSNLEQQYLWAVFTRQANKSDEGELYEIEYITDTEKGANEFNEDRPVRFGYKRLHHVEQLEVMPKGAKIETGHKVYYTADDYDPTDKVFVTLNEFKRYCRYRYQTETDIYDIRVNVKGSGGFNTTYKCDYV